jgi:hypothetical protein
MSVKGLEGINANAEIGVTTVRGATFALRSSFHFLKDRGQDSFGRGVT